MKEEIQIGKTHLKILPMSRLIKKHFKKLFTSDSEVLRTVNGDHILTIFKNGRSSCCEYAQANGLDLITMQKGNNTKTISLIHIFLRDPMQRFVSGVHTYSVFNGINIDKKFLHSVESFKIVDKHFAPQIFYLIHLFKFYKGKVAIHPLSDLKNFITNHKKPHPYKKITQSQKKVICSIQYEKYIEDDQKLIKNYIGKTIDLKNIVKEFKHVLSAS